MSTRNWIRDNVDESWAALTGVRQIIGCTDEKLDAAALHEIKNAMQALVKYSQMIGPCARHKRRMADAD